MLEGGSLTALPELEIETGVRLEPEIEIDENKMEIGGNRGLGIEDSRNMDRSMYPFGEDSSSPCRPD